MATKLFIKTLVSSDYGTGNNDARLSGTAAGWYAFVLSQTAGTAAQTLATTTVAGPTNGLEAERTAGNPMCFYSPPLAADATISGSIIWNLWAFEAAMTANVAINGQIEVVDGATGAITLIDKTARTTEVGTAAAVNNFAETPAAGVAVKRGDRLRVRIFGDDSIDGNMLAGSTFSVVLDGPTAGASGDSYLTLTENLTFEPEPEGTVVYLTDSVSPVATAAVDRIAATSRGAGVQTDVRNTAAGWTAPLQVTDTAGGTVSEWYTDVLPALTLGGAVRCNIRALESNAAANASIGVEIARVAGDGSSPTVWALGRLPSELGTTEAAHSFLISGDDLAITSGQRLRIRVVVDDSPLAAMASGNTVTLYYAGTTAGASGDTWLQFPINLDGSPIPPKVYFRTTVSDYGTGNNDANLVGVASIWGPLALSVAPGAAATNYSTPTLGNGPTSGVEVAVSGGATKCVWYSPPLDADVTIAGPITWNIWAFESSSANDVAINAVIERVDGATGTVTQILKTARTTELTTGGFAVNNFAEAPPSGVACKRGDRLRVRILVDDAPTMVGGGTAQASINGPAGASGDSWLRLTEAPTFAAEPAGTRLYLTNEASDVATAAVDREAWRGRGQAVQTDVTNTAAGWTAPIFVTDTAGGTAAVWYTRPLGAMTLGGAVRCNVRVMGSTTGTNSTAGIEIARVEADGSSPTVWAIGRPAIGIGNFETTLSFLVSGDDLAITEGQRLRIRVFIDDAAAAAMAGSLSVTLFYGGSTAAASGDTYLTFPTLDPATRADVGAHRCAQRAGRPRRGRHGCHEQRPDRRVDRCVTGCAPRLHTGHGREPAALPDQHRAQRRRWTPVRQRQEPPEPRGRDPRTADHGLLAVRGHPAHGRRLGVLHRLVHDRRQGQQQRPLLLPDVRPAGVVGRAGIVREPGHRQHHRPRCHGGHRGTHLADIRCGADLAQRRRQGLARGCVHPVLRAVAALHRRG